MENEDDSGTSNAPQHETRLDVSRAEVRRYILRQIMLRSLRSREIEDEFMEVFLPLLVDEMRKSYVKVPYHTSILTGHAWVHELLRGHPDRIRTELGVNRHVFLRLIVTLADSGLTDSRYVALEEQLAIFLYICVTGLSMRHAGERFQRSNDTISKYFNKILIAFSSAPFYTTHVSLPQATEPIPSRIRRDPKFYPWFKDALGAIDGTHINCAPAAVDRDAARNYKGGMTQNCLAACTFDMMFVYIYSGWEGSAADSAMFNQARITDLRIPHGKYYLADAGFPACASLLVPYRGVRYHLQEWGRANVRPRDPQELFNLRHASARNVVERIFGVLKRRFRILRIPPEIDMELQARIPCALGALHNFIRTEDPRDVEDFELMPVRGPQGAEAGELSASLTRPAAERQEALAQRDVIANAMWQNYQQILRERG